MAAPRYEGPFAGMIGHEDLLRPTAPRLAWLMFGLACAVALGFAIGLAVPRRRAAERVATS